MKVAFVIPNLGKGGAEHAVIRITDYLSQNHEVSIILFNRINNEYKTNCRIIDLDLPVKKNIINKFFTFLKRKRKLKKIKKQEKFDVVISFLQSANILNILTRKYSKTFISIRNHITKSSRGFYGKLNKCIVRLFYNKADKIVALTREIKKDLIENYNINEHIITIINNGYPIEQIEELAKQQLTPIEQEIFNDKTIVNVGRLTYQKRQDLLIKAFSNISNEFNDYKIVFIGIGPRLEKLKQLSIDLGIANKIIFYGSVDNPYKYMKNSKLFVLSSIYEGFPNVLCEAMICRVPILTSNCLSGPFEIMVNSEADILRHEDNFIYTKQGNLFSIYETQTLNEENIVKTLSIEIKRMILQDNSDIIENAYERVKHYHIENIGQEWDKIINSYGK